ncbi:hypothetical protein FVO59_05850 [Microbacterium esteraromaticum]|uniref:Uncharacterized protein n=1 Tax=Microbacterium esteraromaticum TaxID=57043 RepID=A0A7D7WC44_9MICO|nr:hypothetical protein [Microbacterium esteraromaticum]QMU96797.1 hypothetical protein FVO59_05850 [Microbacterium esteraromaticum]
MPTVPPRRRAWTRGTTALLIVCVVVAGLAVATAALLPGHLRDGARRDAEAALRAFLDDATQGDPDWRDLASPMLHGVAPIGAPVVGEEQTADALQLTASYTTGDLRFAGRTLESSDTASAMVTIRYRYRILGERGTASIPQRVWLTRPFYYDSAVPQRADAKKTPSAVGPWRVTGITLPAADERGARAASDLVSDARNPADDFACETPARALAEISDEARIDATLTSSCFLGADDGADVLAEGIDREALIAAFPAIDDTDPATMPPELMRVEGDAMHALRAPFTQYLVADRYVLTFAAVGTEDDESATRLVRIEDLGAR